MAKKSYTKDEVKELLQENFKAFSVYQLDCDYEDEYRVQILEEQEIQDRMHVKVVSTLTAIKNEADFSDDNNYWKDIVEILLSGEELVQIGAYTKLADDLFWRAF